VQKLLEQGFKVAICEQMADPSKVKGIVPRDGYASTANFTGVHLTTLMPVDKEKNADALRRVVDAEPDFAQTPAPSGIAPLLRELMSDYAATGLPPAYVPLGRKETT
jgi:hypothetical protein